jgi:hypothetical protein
VQESSCVEEGKAIMTSFVSPDFPRTHGGLTRMTDGLSAVHSLTSRANSSKGTAAALVAGGVAAAIVVADQIVSAWADGHLLLAWIAMWAIVFALLAVFSEAIRTWPTRLQGAIGAYLLARREAAADARTWSAAVADPRLMAELDIARTRAEQSAQARGETLPQWPFARHTTRHLLPLRWN